jgi:hypothetical protein
MQLNHGERGQALVESALFLPVVLLVLFGAMYVGQFGVVSERAQLAVRYGGVTAAQSSNLYSAAAIYQGVANPTLPAACPTPPVDVMEEGGPLPGPVSDPYWRATSAVGTCQAAAYRIGGAQFLASHFFAVSVDTVTATFDVASRAPYLQPFLGGTLSTSARQSFAHPADPGTILYCSQEVQKRVSNAIQSATAAAATPPPAPGNTPPPPLTFSC